MEPTGCLKNRMSAVSKFRKIAVFSTEPVTEKLGGLGIRQLEIARVLNQTFKVKLLTPFPIKSHKEKFTIELINYEYPETFEPYLRWADAAYVNHPVVGTYARKYGKPVAVDLLVHEYFEDLERLPLSDMTNLGKDVYFADNIGRVIQQLAMGDFFIVPSERSRNYYLGMLTLLGKLHPENYSSDPHFKSLIDIVPFGLPNRKPKSGKNLLRKQLPGIGAKDFLIIWGGTLANWFDCITPIKAMDRLKSKHPNIKLVFIGSTHPIRSKQPEIFNQVYKNAKKRGLLNKTVFFFTDWVPFDQRDYYLSESDAGLVTCRDHIENHFSQRIRLLDYLWGELPVLTNPGNVLSHLIEKEDLGILVPFGDDKYLARSIEYLASRPDLRKQMQERIRFTKRQLQWKKALEPLIQFFQNPRYAQSIFKEGQTPTIKQITNRYSPSSDELIRQIPAHPYLQLPAARQKLKEGKVTEAASLVGDYIRQYGDGLENPIFKDPLLGEPEWFSIEELERLQLENRFVVLLRAKRALNQGRVEEAKQIIEDETLHFGEQPELQFFLGLLFQKNGDHSAAVKAFEEFRKQVPSRYEFWLPLAESRFILGDFSSARKLYKEIWSRALKNGDQWVRTKAAIGIARLEANRKPECETLNRFLKRDLGNEGLTYATASAFERAKKFEDARKCFDNCTRSFVDKKLKAGAWFRLARLSPSSQRKPMLDACLKLEPSHREAKRMLKEL